MKSFAVRLLTICLLLTTINACQKVDFDSDLQLIEAIEAASNKTTVELSSLPSSAQTVLNSEYSESFTQEVLMAEELGYQVEMIRGRSSRMGERVRAFFDQRGRELRRDNATDRNATDRRTTDGRDIRECFSLVYPITLIMPDRSTLTGSDADDLARKIRRWYHANPRHDARPQLQYPVTVEFPANDRTSGATILVVNNETEMERVRARCD